MRTVELSDETFEKLKDQLGGESVVEIENYGDMIGKKFFFRTVTYHLVGRVKRRVGNFLELEQSSWIADSGRFMQFIKEGKLEEVEPAGTCYINIYACVDFYPWLFPLPTEQK